MGLAGRARIRESYDGGKANLEPIKRNGNGFPIAREALGSSVERHEMTVYEISPERLGHIRLRVRRIDAAAPARPGRGARADPDRRRRRGRVQRVHRVRPDQAAAGGRRWRASMPRTACWWWQPNLAALHSMIEQAGSRSSSAASRTSSRSARATPRQADLGDMLRRLRSPKGWEELCSTGAASPMRRSARAPRRLDRGHHPLLDRARPPGRPRRTRTPTLVT